MHRSWISSRGKSPSDSPPRRRARWVAAVAALTLPVAVLTAPLALAGTTPPFTIGPANDAVVPGNDASINLPDLYGNKKELGPKNSNTTKIGVIQDAAVPMLDLTNPNGQVDLRQAWLGSAKDSDKDDWIYFAWERDAANGSGFIAFEFMKNAAPVACNFDGTVSDSDLIATCNPWKNRADGDFMILWDQQGGSKDLWLRKWSGTGSNLTLSAPELIPTSYGQADYSADGFRGEAAVNITDAIYGGVQQCLSFANIIPSTVTGNSDSADYKDTIFSSGITLGGCTTTTTTTPTLADGTTSVPAAGVSITTAGVVQVKDSASISLTGGSGSPGGSVQFSLCKADNSAGGPGNVPPATSTCDSAATTIGTPVSVTGSAFPVTVVSPSAWVTAAGRYCWQAVYSGVSASGIAGSSDTSVGECFTVNPVTPTVATTASADVVVGQTVSDSATVTGLAPKPTTPVILTSAPGARTAASGTVTFTLYGPDSCSTVASGPVNGSINPSGVASTPTPQFVATEPGTYHWKAVYNGDSPNNTASATHNTACDDTDEDVVVSPIQPAITTTATATAVLGSTISDTASITGGYFPVGSTPGNVTFKLYGPFAVGDPIGASSCVDDGAGANLIAAATSTVAATRTGSSTASATATAYQPTAPGKYAWVASYAGNAQNLPVSGTCGDDNEASIITRAPASLATAQNLRPQDSVTVAAAVGGTPTGTVTFKLYGPNNATCDPAGAAPVYTESAVGLNAGGSAVTSNTTFSISAANASQYKWLVSYSGDDNHLPISGSCGSENFTLTISNGSSVTS